MQKKKKKKRVLTTDVEVKKGLNLAVRQGDQFERHKVGRRKVLFMDSREERRDAVKKSEVLSLGVRNDDAIIRDKDQRRKSFWEMRNPV